MSTQDLSEAIVEWALEVCPGLNAGYEYATDRKDAALPDVGVEIVTTTNRTTADERFPRLNVQQIDVLKVSEFNLLLMVSPEPAANAAEELAGYADALMDAVLSDATLGGRVLQAGYGVSASFNPPFVEFDDGTRGRLCTVSIAIAEPKVVD